MVWRSIRDRKKLMKSVKTVFKNEKKNKTMYTHYRTAPFSPKLSKTYTLCTDLGKM